jgi:hypothetical protein
MIIYYIYICIYIYISFYIYIYREREREIMWNCETVLLRGLGEGVEEKRMIENE